MVALGQLSSSFYPILAPSSQAKEDSPLPLPLAVARQYSGATGWLAGVRLVAASSILDTWKHNNGWLVSPEALAAVSHSSQVSCGSFAP